MVEKEKHIRCRTILEVLGKPREHVEKTIKDYIEKIKEDPDLIILKESFADAKQHEKLWAVFAELEVVVKGIPKLVAFCLDYMPSSIEVIKPEELVFKNRDISNFMNDLQAKLHNVDMVAKQFRAENEFLRRNMKTSFKNAVAILLRIGDKDTSELSKFTGIPQDELKPIMEELIKDKRIKKEEDKYKLIE
jgi:hypothetical protein